MKKIHHFLCKVSILDKHSPETTTNDSQCDCDFIIDLLEKEDVSA